MEMCGRNSNKILDCVLIDLCVCETVCVYFLAVSGCMCVVDPLIYCSELYCKSINTGVPRLRSRKLQVLKRETSRLRTQRS